MEKKTKTDGLGPASLIIALALAAGILITLSPPLIEAWALSLLFVLVLVVASIKFAALSLASFRRKKRLLGGLWALLSLEFLLLLIVRVTNIFDLPK